MYKFFLYCMLLIIYLGLAKTLSPTEMGVHYLQNEKGFSKIIKSELVTAILLDTHATGFLIKSYYQKYRIISGLDNVEELIIRTNKDFAKKNLQFIGLSIYRKFKGKEELTPMPPGSLYINQREFGDWKLNKSGQLKWTFNKSFKHFPRYLGWGKFKPNAKFYEELKNNLAIGRPFYGSNNEFGPNGYITRKNFPNFFKNKKHKKLNLNSIILNYFKENF